MMGKWLFFRSKLPLAYTQERRGTCIIGRLSLYELLAILYVGVKWVIKADRDKKIKFCCLQSKAAEPYMSVCDLDRDDVRRRFLFIEGPGLYHQGSTG